MRYSGGDLYGFYRSGKTPKDGSGRHRGAGLVGGQHPRTPDRAPSSLGRESRRQPDRLCGPALRAVSDIRDVLLAVDFSLEAGRSCPAQNSYCALRLFRIRSRYSLALACTERSLIVNTRRWSITIRPLMITVSTSEAFVAYASCEY